ncbi:MAG: VWA domain-containing protein [Ruminiclostridium sp.]|nr:VWA domain-containing protein [Ruminiclostridium sp.]
MKKRITASLLIAALIASAASCAGGTGSSSPAATAAPSEGKSAADGGSKGEASEGYAPVTTAAATPAATYALDYAAEDYVWEDDFKVDDTHTEPKLTDQSRAGLLTGGEWRDNTNFAYWRSLFAQRKEWQEISEEWRLNTLDRVLVRVKCQGQPGAGLTVKLASGNKLLWETVTDSRGEAFLFAGITSSDSPVPDKIIVETADVRAVTADVPKDYKDTDTAVEIEMPDPAPMRTQLDLMFMIDTTGSMSDELRYLQSELASVIDRVMNETGVQTMLSVNFYRDEGDDYVVRDFGFTDRINIAIEHLEDQRADGGGDYPEAVTRALKNGIAGHEWRSGSEKLMFLVLDAPPHRDDGIAELENIIRTAAQKGIRIIPVASSGVNTDTEFLCRTMAIATGGTYTFLTDDSGIGDSHLEPTIGSYTVERLNDMLVRIITDYFSQEPRSYNTQAPASQQQQQPVLNVGYPAGFSYTHDYFSGEGMYTSGLITDREELAKFRETYGSGLIDREPDFSERIIAYDVVLLSSGSITVNTDAGVFVEIKDGKPVFHYELNIPEVGTADIVTLFLLADLPRTAL